MTSTIKTATVSTRTIAGTDYPVDVTLTRFAPAGRRPTWTVATVCNGVADCGQEWRTRRDADAFFAEVVSVWTR